MRTECDGMVMASMTASDMADLSLRSRTLTTSSAGSAPSTSAAGWNDDMDSHQRVWNAIDAMAWKAGLTPCGLAKAAGMDATVFNRSKRVDPRGRPRWPSVETIQKILDATGTTWPAFARLVEGSMPNTSYS